MLLVAAGLIYKDRQLLITQRPPGKHGALKWEFPGGKVEEGEDPRDCLRREIWEELRVKVEVQKIQEVVFHRYPDRTVLLLFYNCVWISGEPVNRECHDFAWTPLDKLTEFDFMEADLDFIRGLTTEAQRHRV